MLDSGIPGSARAVSLAFERAGGCLRADLAVAGAAGLKALLCEVRYDAGAWHPVRAQASGLLARGSAAEGEVPAVIELAVLDEPGVARCGQVLAHPGEAAGFSGDGVLASFWFEPGPQPPQRAADWTQPTVQGPQIYVDRAAKSFSWWYDLPGDYDQNFEVGLSDIVPLAMHFSEQRGVDGDFSQGTIQHVVDGDGNGEINLGDIVPISRHFGETAGSYNLYATTDPIAEYPSGDDPRLDVAPLKVLNLVTTLGPPDPPADSQMVIHFPVPEVQRGVYYWIRALSQGAPGAVGPPSPIALNGTVTDPHYGAPEYRDQHYGLSYDPVAHEVSFYPVFRCDGDRSGAVNIADLTALGTHFGSVVPADHADISWNIDASRDGVINIDELLFMKTDWGQRIDGYHLYLTDSTGELPFDPWAPSIPAPVASFGYNSIVQPPAAWQPFVFSDNAPVGRYFWVRPYYGGEEGPASEVIQVPPV